MKKFFATLAAITAALALSLAFAACGDGNVPAPTPTPEPEPPVAVELTKEQIKKAFDNTINAENVTFSLYPVDNTIFVDGTNKRMFMNTSEDYTVVAEGDGESFVIKEYKVPSPSEQPPYTTTNSVTDMCEQIAGKKITSFAELSAIYISATAHLDIIKEMEFTYNAEDNCYLAQPADGAWLKCYFNGSGDNALLNRFVMGQDGSDLTTEFRFYDYGTTVAPAPTANHVLVYSSDNQ